MAKVSITNQHDYMRFIVTFEDGRKAKGNFSRGGETVKTEPEDLNLLRTISRIFVDNAMRMKRDPEWNLGMTFDVVKRIGDEAKSLEGFLAALDAEIGNPDQAPQPEASSKAMATVQKKGRGWIVDCAFPSGETSSITVNGKSLSLRMQPPLSGLMDAMSGSVFGGLALAEPQEVAERLRDAALESPDLVGWIENFRAFIAPAPRR